MCIRKSSCQPPHTTNITKAWLYHILILLVSGVHGHHSLWGDGAQGGTVPKHLRCLGLVLIGDIEALPVDSQSCYAHTDNDADQKEDGKDHTPYNDANESFSAEDRHRGWWGWGWRRNDRGGWGRQICEGMIWHPSTVTCTTAEDI